MQGVAVRAQDTTALSWGLGRARRSRSNTPGGRYGRGGGSTHHHLAVQRPRQLDGPRRGAGGRRQHGHGRRAGRVPHRLHVIWAQRCAEHRHARELPFEPAWASKLNVATPHTTAWVTHTTGASQRATIRLAVVQRTRRCLLCAQGAWTTLVGTPAWPGARTVRRGTGARDRARRSWVGAPHTATSTCPRQRHWQAPQWRPASRTQLVTSGDEW